MALKVVLFLNSTFGKTGAIGFRALQIVQLNPDFEFKIICKDSKLNSQTIKIYNAKNRLVSMKDTQRYVFIFLKFVKFFFPVIAVRVRQFESSLFEKFCLKHIECRESLVAPDLVHVWDYCPLVSRAFNEKNTPVIQEVPILPPDAIDNNSQLAAFSQPKGLVRRQRQAFNHSDQILVPSKFIYQSLRPNEKNKTSIVKFGVGFDVKKPEISHQKQKGIDFCFVGNVGKRKGFFELIQAFADPEFAEDRLHVYGRYPPWIKLWCFLINKKNIWFYGVVDIKTHLPNSDVLVLPSWIEGSSKAVLEAMYFGVPVIVTRNCGSPVKNNFSGILVDAGDVSQIKAAMLRLKGEPQTRKLFSERGMLAALHLSWHRYSANVRQVYTRMVNEYGELENKDQIS